MSSLIDDLPLELQYRLLSALDYKDIISLCRVNNQYRHICKDIYFWTSKAKHDFGQDVIIFPDALTSPIEAYIELYSQYHLPDNCQKYLSLRGCMIRAIGDNNLNGLIELSTWLNDDDQYEVPYDLSYQYNYVPGIKYFGYRSENHSFFVYGMNAKVNELKDLSCDEQDFVSQIAGGAAYANNKTVLLYLLDNYCVNLFSLGYSSGRGGNDIGYLSSCDDFDGIIQQYLIGSLESGYDVLSNIHIKDYYDLPYYIFNILKFGTGDTKIIKKLLSACVIGDDKIIMAHEAIYNFNFEALKLLLDDRYLIDGAVSAIWSQNRYLLKYLIWRGLDVHALIDTLIGEGLYSFDDDIEHGFKKDDFYIIRLLELSTSQHNIDRLKAHLFANKPKLVI